MAVTTREMIKIQRKFGMNMLNTVESKYLEVPSISNLLPLYHIKNSPKHCLKRSNEQRSIIRAMEREQTTSRKEITCDHIRFFAKEISRCVVEVQNIRYLISGGENFLAPPKTALADLSPTAAAFDVSPDLYITKCFVSLPKLYFGSRLRRIGHHYKGTNLHQA